MQDLFAEAMHQLLAAHSSPAIIRAIEHSGDVAVLWQHLEDSGFMDALVEDERGGAGLSLTDVFSIVLACGRHALPAPLAQTLFVRALGGKSSAPLPKGPITIAPSCTRHVDGSLHCIQVPFGLVAEWTLIALEESAWLLPVSAAQSTAAGGNGCLDADLRWRSLPDQAIALDHFTEWSLIGATATAALMAGALEKIFEMTVAYADDRIQFGKPIGKLQAIQQQLSVMAEHVFAARMAAQIGFLSETAQPDLLRGAVAKERTSAVAAAAAATAHAVHGAMGFTEEYDLQLYTRRLHEWRMAYGSETFWSARLGHAALSSSQARSLDFVRESIMAQSSTR